MQGWLTKVGGHGFERSRRELAKLAERKVDDVSDADTMEFLARGREATIAYLEKQR